MLNDRSINPQQKNIGYAFSGGGVRSWAELAAYEEFVRQGIEVTAVSGTSMGSFIASAVACDYSMDEILDIILSADRVLDEGGLFSPSLRKLLGIKQTTGMVLQQSLRETIQPISPMFDLMLSEVPKPLAIPAVNLVDGCLVIFTNQPDYFHGFFKNAVFYDRDIPLIDACLASSSYPVMIEPLRIDDYQLADGGLLMNSPAILFSPDKIEYIFASHTQSIQDEGLMEDQIDVAIRALDLMINHQAITQTKLINQDYMITLDIKDLFKFGDAQNILDMARQFVQKNPIRTDDMYH